MACGRTPRLVTTRDLPRHASPPLRHMLTTATHEPLTDDEFERLGSFLEKTGPPGVNCEWVDGHFAALICGPELTSPSEGLKEILGDDVVFDSQEQASDIIGRRVLQEAQEAIRRAERVARGQAGTLRVGFVESISWHGVVPESFRRFRQKQPDAELIPVPMLSLPQIEAVQSGKLDAGFVASWEELGGELDHRPVARHKVVLAAPRGHSITRRKKLRLRDLEDVPFVGFPRRANPAAYDRMMENCFAGGLRSPRIVQEADDQATILSLVSCRLGVALVSDSTQWQCPKGVALVPIVDLKLPVIFSMIWRKDNKSPLLQKFVAQVGAVVDPKRPNPPK
jgi:DNA-binding transcriptional LysR family regulator